MATLASACGRPDPPSPPSPSPPPAVSITAAASPELPALPPSAAVYPWTPTAKERLDGRFAAPLAFHRVAAGDGTFGAFLRSLPLLPDGAPVVDYQGTPLYDAGHHPGIAAVVDLDVGTANLQQCADAVIRLHAEWRYGRGDRALAYRSMSGAAIPYARYLAGEHAVSADGNGLAFVRRGGPARDDHKLFRSYLDDVFAWANTRSLERDAARVAFAELAAGDFFVMSGSPFGHTVLVLDVARDERGRVALLLGQSFMPAQSFHVLRGSAREAWFIVEPGASELETPFWPAFPMEALRRL